MTKVEQEYRNNIGKLFFYKGREWDYNKGKWVVVNALVMVVDVTKNGGWFHYVSDILNRDMQIKNEAKQYTIGCKEFHRKAMPAAVSLAGDTWKKEIA